VGVELRKLLACFAAVALFPLGASGQTACRVLDPELAAIYQGGCKDGLAEGYGDAKGAAEYHGNFHAGRKHGKGVKTWPSGDRYEGEFVEDRKEGAGRYTWSPRGPSAGESYSGAYLNDRRHGYGVYEWPSGDRYAGPWAQDASTGPPTPMMIAREQVPPARPDDADTKAEEKRVADRLPPDSRPVGRVLSDLSAAGRTAADANWLRMGVVGTGLVLASSALDRRGEQFAKDHANSRWLKSVSRIGDALPWLAIAGTSVAALYSSDPAFSRTGYAATEAGGTAFLAVTGLKYVVGRARPGNELGNHAFKPFSSASGYDSLPSGHVIISWAIATPFAEEYDAPWLYGVAAVTNLARFGSRQHWLSDTVAGSVLGFAIGKVFWESSRAPKKGGPLVLIHPSGINMAWELN